MKYTPLTIFSKMKDTISNFLLKLLIRLSYRWFLLVFSLEFAWIRIPEVLRIRMAARLRTLTHGPLDVRLVPRLRIVQVSFLHLINSFCLCGDFLLSSRTLGYLLSLDRSG